ncbi:MAG: right-handed parallel beta-helix repeat-containing protein [Nitrospirota bacterium]
MKKTVLIIVLAIFMMTVSCGSSGNSNSSSSDSTAVTIRLGQSGPSSAGVSGAVSTSALPTGVTMVRVTVSAEDMVTVIKEVSVAGLSSVTITLDIPNGPNRLILVEALDASGNVMYSGETVVNLNGEPVQLTISMLPACNLFVEVNGVDESDCTDSGNPCGSVTYALTQTSGNMNICVAAGTYTDQVITLKAGVGIVCRGAGHSSIIVTPFGEVAYTSMLGAPDSFIRGCYITGGIDDDGENITINDCELNGGGSSAGIVLSGNSEIKNSHIADYSGEGDNAVTINGGNSTLSNNTIDNNWDGIVISGGNPNITGNIISSNWSGMSISAGAPVISGNTISGNDWTGIYISGTAVPTISGNSVTGNAIGVYVWGGVPVVSGNNVLSCNTSVDLENLTSSVIDARNNKWDHASPSVSNYPDGCATGVDVCNTDIVPGSVNVSGSTQTSSPCL